MKRLLLFAVLLLPLHAVAEDGIQGLLQMLDYVAVDYPGAVVDGEVVHAGEYAEMAASDEGFRSWLQRNVPARRAA